MTPLQIALIVVGLFAAVLIFWMSRRNRDSLKDWSANGDANGLPSRPRAEQLDMFNSTGQFDEFGVGRVVRKVEPGLSPQPHTAAIPQPVAPKSFALLIAEREGTHILGIKIHTALKSHGLQFGQGEIYHRYSDGDPVFSVAGLLKPGTLNPAEAMRFSSPGLSMFMSLPGPLPATAAFREFVATAQSLARSLNSEVMDMRRQQLTPDTLTRMEREVEDWARDNPMR